ncbi:MAG: hypothetical protein E7504_05585 [Ruminococcus sp.]|nr:hypothetical protein [Ruminococcus sp.]
MSENKKRKSLKNTNPLQKVPSKVNTSNETNAPAVENKKRQVPIWEILSFILPFVMLGIGFAMIKIHPFGDRQFLVTDLWHQYYPFFRVLHEKLREGGSLLYTWTSGMGTNFLAIMAYYAASPLNLLSVLVSEEYLRETMTVILMLKFSFAGLFFSRMLRYCFGKNDISICMFSVMYALCSYMMGYYWNTIWIDTVALLPLVMHGLTALVREGKYRTYVIALALALLSNYYIAYFICIFTVLAFFCLCLYEKLDLRTFGKRFALVAGGSLFGAGLSAWILLPAYHALQLTHSVSNTFPKEITFYEGWREIISNMLAFTEVTSKSGLPNLYCGLLPVLLLGAFLVAKNIRIREKITAVLLMVFLIVSCNMNILNFIWHGFHFTNMLPYRFSFLFSFVVLVAAYRAYHILLDEKLSIWQWFGMLASAVLFLTLSYGARTEGNDPNKFVIASGILASVYLIIVLCRTFMPKSAVQILLAAVLAFEMGQHAINGVKTVGSSDYVSYPSSGEHVDTLLAQIEDTEDDLFYRTELSAWYSLNDPSLYGYDGFSQFSSMANKRVTTFSRLIGMPASEAGNRYYYANTSPFTNMLLNIQYMIAKDGYNADELSMSRIGVSGNCTLYRNDYATSLGFMSNPAAASYKMDTTLNPFEQQNVVFRRMTEVGGELFTRIDITHVGHKGYEVSRNGYGSYSYTRKEDAPAESFLKYNYTTLKKGMVYAYMTVKNGDNMLVYHNGDKKHSYNISRQPFITPVGYYDEGELVTLRCNLKEDAKSGTIKVYFYQLNEDVLKEGYEALSDEMLKLTKFSDTAFTGEIDVKQAGCLYMSVPYEEGWTVYVDGKKSKIVPVFDAMCGVNLTEGTHTITMKYSPKGFVMGLVISISAVVLFVVLYVLERRRKMMAAAVPTKAKKKNVSGKS